MYLEDFINYIKSEKRFSNHTITSYETDLNQFFNFIQLEYQITKPQDVSFKLIRNWISLKTWSELDAQDYQTFKDLRAYLVISIFIVPSPLI